MPTRSGSVAVVRRGAPWFTRVGWRLLGVAGALGVFAQGPLPAQSILGEAEERVIGYETKTNLSDPITRLQKALVTNAARLDHETNRGYLPSLLRALGIPISSQTLVFSKTSSQRAHVSPQTPRAIYFNDEVSLAWTPGAPEIDLAAVDSTQGQVFYTLSQAETRSPVFSRRNDCLQCHFGPKTFHVPGLLVRSFYTDTQGMPVSAVPGFATGHGSPLSTRWGGWYVTGHSSDAHLGNLLVENSELPKPANSPAPQEHFNSSRYLTPHSDIVALLVLEHQVRMQNLITRANFETRLALDPEISRSGSPDWPRQRIAAAGEMLLEYMLFRDEAPLAGPTQGTSGFGAEFERSGPRDSHGRSLRELDLQSRLFKYPCSYMIYSPAFDSLPETMKRFLWGRLDEILTGDSRSFPYATLTDRDRRDLFQILRETKPEFAAWLNERHKVARN